ncbi:MAG TPA: PucR family transcriptional regulator ligand-binding domain-containing protein [Capillimicrobium sp.]|nr:PucR family transcriptional regulator ligand-binding domain-containing protein [Capillimicrobium sp.]
MLTVQDLVRDLGLELLTGHDAAGSPLRWVHISEEPDPTPWLSGGELLLCTGLGLGDDAEQRRYVERLADHGLAGLGFGATPERPQTPPALLEAAADCGFPVFEVPTEIPFIAVTERAFSTLVNENYAVLRRSISAQERLQRIVLSERGLDAIAGALASLLGGAVLIADGRGQWLARRTFRREVDEDVADRVAGQLHAHARARTADEFAPGDPELGGRALALPVGATGDPGRRATAAPQAWIVAIKDRGGLDEFDRLLLHQATTVVALELLRRRVAGTTERRLAGDILTQLADGELRGADLARRLEPFGIGRTVAALALTSQSASDRLEDVVEAAVRAEAVDGLVARTGTLTCALVPGYPEDELVELAERVAARAGEALGEDAHVAVGAGRAVDAGDARRAYHEARWALEARAMAAGPDDGDGHRNGNGNGNGSGNGRAAAATLARPVVATHRDLGSFQLLLSLQDSEALRLYCDSLLGPLEDGEGAYGNELMRSLEAFIECNGQWETAARRLYCHRHTLRYRVRRIEELTGRDLSSARDRIEFWLALRGRELAGR